MSDTPRLAAGLYVVSTPIGAASDITLRALDVLRRADVIAAEDTRVTRRLMEIHGVPVAGRPLVPYHDHNGAAQRPRLLGMPHACSIDKRETMRFPQGFQSPLSTAEGGPGADSP